MQMVNSKRVEIHFVAHLNLVTPIDKQQRAVAQHQRQPGGAGKTGQPLQLIVVRGAIFALMSIGARNDDAVQIPRNQLVAQSLKRRESVHVKSF
ncbi:hypothetical protein ACUY4R_004610 [Kosakonia sp. BK9b]